MLYSRAALARGATLPSGHVCRVLFHLFAVVTKAFEYRGDLAHTTLPEMLFTIFRFQVPGILEARRETVVKRVYVRDGAVLHATSSDIDDSLGGYLKRTGRLPADEFDAMMRMRAETKRRFGALLVERGLLGPHEVYVAIREQVEAIVWSLFYWQDGEVGFRIGEFPPLDQVRIQVPVRQVILAGIKRAPNPKALLARLGKKETVFEPCYQVEELIETGLDNVDFALLKLVDGKRTLFDVCTHGPLPPADNAKLMYAFQVLQLIRRAEARAEAGAATKSDPGKIKIRLKTEWDRGGEE